MSCCGGNCSCGSSCSCGSGCKGCNMDTDLLNSGEKSVGSTILHLTSSDMGFTEAMTVTGENGGCKCGSNCTCDPCNCK